MAHFLATGTIGGVDVWIRWEDGKITGDAPTVDLLKGLAKTKKGQLLGHEFGLSRRRAHLKHMESALALVNELFDEVTSYTDSEPEDEEARVY